MALAYHTAPVIFIQNSSGSLPCIPACVALTLLSTRPQHLPLLCSQLLCPITSPAHSSPKFFPTLAGVSGQLYVLWRPVFHTPPTPFPTRAEEQKRNIVEREPTWKDGVYFIFFLILFIHERHREAETDRGRSRLHAGSLTWDPILGLQDHTPGWGQAKPLHHPGCPGWSLKGNPYSHMTSFNPSDYYFGEEVLNKIQPTRG